MRASITIVLIASACGDNLELSGFEGDYQMVSVRTQEGGCDGSGTPREVPPTEMWFHLEDTEIETGPLVAYHACHELGACNEVIDLYRSFGIGDDGWVTVIASAIQPPCKLGYRKRLLSRVDAMTIRIDETLQEAIDDTLSGDACSLAAAKARKDELPCVGQSAWTAEQRMP